MFTGIVRALGVVHQVRQTDDGIRISIRSDGLPWPEYGVGDSISVNGVCLTAVLLDENGFEADLSPETMNVTAMRNAAAGTRVNLEPSLAIGDRLGGHLVSGHVDCVGKVIDIEEAAGSARLRIGIPGQYLRYAVKKGSICVDGASLTINEVLHNSLHEVPGRATAGWFDVNIVPHTAAATIAGSYETGTEVNIEVDLIARYLEGLLAAGADPAAHADGSRGITRNFLRAHGYA
jgi:riboflavin synthase